MDLIHLTAMKILKISEKKVSLDEVDKRTSLYSSSKSGFNEYL